MQTVMPGNVNKVKFYRDDVPFFSRFQIEHQIERLFARVALPAGGGIVIDRGGLWRHVNSARATRGGDIEETAYRTNLESPTRSRAARLRDLGASSSSTYRQESQKPARGRELAARASTGRACTGKISRFGR
jgi:ribonuclease E